MDFFSKLLPTDNPVFGGGLGLAVLGAALQAARLSASFAFAAARKRSVTSFFSINSLHFIFLPRLFYLLHSLL
jgi:hypothetical protein